MNTERIIDANINRAAEGLRVIEDHLRFQRNDKPLSLMTKSLRHGIRKSLPFEPIFERNALGDIGLEISKETKLDQKESLSNLLDANFKRVQESLRTIEEYLKILGYYEASKVYEAYRFDTYTLEGKCHKNPFPRKALYGILGEEFSKGRDNLTVTKSLVEAGIKVIQYREKKKNKREKLKDCQRIKDYLKDKDVLFIINDDVDIALAIEADGIHLGQDDLHPNEVRKLMPNKIIGLSTHNEEQVREANMLAIDYIGVGPIFITSTKENPEHCDGLPFLKWINENSVHPHVAIGGINKDNIQEVLKSNADSIAIISGLIGQEDIKVAGKDYIKIMRENENV